VVGAGRALLALVVVVMLRWTPSSKKMHRALDRTGVDTVQLLRRVVEARASRWMTLLLPACLVCAVIGQGLASNQWPTAFDRSMPRSIAAGGPIYTPPTPRASPGRPPGAGDRSEIAHETDAIFSLQALAPDPSGQRETTLSEIERRRGSPYFLVVTFPQRLFVWAAQGSTI
jgi:hypothetical protein